MTGNYKPNYTEENSSLRGRVQCVFSINQSEVNRISGESNVPFMTQLASFFHTNLLHKITKNIKFKSPAKLVVFYAQADKNHSFIISYLNKFPLMSSKHLNYLKASLYIKAIQYLGKRLSVEQVKQIRLLKQSMNKNRIEFTWDHLNNFYKNTT